jgi:glycosyltransferase involved in cell wall biosynthesis
MNKPLPNYKNYQNLNDEQGVLHFFGFTCLFIGILMRTLNKAGRVVVYTPCMHPFDTHKSPFLAKCNFFLLIRPSLKKVDKIVVLSTLEQVFFEKYVDKNKIELIPSGIDFIEVQKVEQLEKNYFLFVGRDDANKRMNVVEMLAKLRPEFQFICLCNTKKDDTANLSYLSKLTNEELKGLYRGAIATLVPSKYESFSLVALESLSAGSPVILSENVQIKTLLPNSVKRVVSESQLLDGFDKSLIDFFKLSRDATAIMNISQDGINVARSCSWDNISSIHFNLYKHLLCDV